MGNELKVKATCTAAAVKGSFTVSVTSSLDSGAGDESFGIDNVVLTKVNTPACKAPKFIKIDSWDNEKAIVKVNGKECWTKKFTSVQGKQICGKNNKNWNELKVKATCTAAAVKGS